MKQFQHMTTTGAAWARQCAEHNVSTDYPFGLIADGSGGPLDATDYMAAGGCNSTEWKNCAGSIPAQTECVRGQS